MDPAAFKTWLEGTRLLNKPQRAVVLREMGLAEVPDRTERPAGAVPDQAKRPKPERGAVANLVCPQCGGNDIRRWGKVSGKPRYRCLNCGKTFNALTGTPLARLRYRDRWQDQVQALVNGDTLAKAAERCGVNQSTAFRWRRRFLEALNRDKPASLSGIVEADETFILESFEAKRSAKGRRSGLAKASTKPNKTKKRSLSAG
jgi:transposase-like protein